MCSPDPISYLLLLDVLKVVLGSLHLARLGTISELVGALLMAQSLHPADLARALPALRTAKARQAFRRVRRVLGRPCLRSPGLTPRLLRAGLHLVTDPEVRLVLDSTRCGRWEIFTVGLRFHGRVLPIAWSILPYPWPKQRFTPTVIDLLARVLACWPADRPVHLVADRGFPSLKLFRLLEQWRQHLALGYTIRLRASDWVRLASGQAVKVADRERGLAAGSWASWPASYQQRGKASRLAMLVVGRGLPLSLTHQRGPADQARRQARRQRRQAHVRSKGQPQAPKTDQVWALLTTRTTWLAAVQTYAGRFATEPMYRDLKSWDLAAVANHEPDAGHLDGLVGLAALGYLIQAAIGAAAGRTEAASARARQQHWSTTDRLSVFWRGRQVLHDRAHDWRPWLTTTLPELAHQLAARRPTPDQRPTRSVKPDRREAA